MSGRPCNPGNDLKGLWQIFLRDTPMPQCEVPADPQSAEDATAFDQTPAKPPARVPRDR